MARKNKRVYKYDSVKDIVQNDKLFQRWIENPNDDEDDKKDKKKVKPKNDEDDKKDKKEGTRQNKTYTMNMFIHYLHKNGMTDATPTKLVSHARAYQKNKNKKFEDAVTPEDFEAILISNDDEIGDYERILMEYKSYLVRLQKPSTAKSNFLRLLAFYKYYNVNVSKINSKMNVPVSTKAKKSPSFELLKKAFDKASLRDKCIISCGVTSGMARLDISTLTYGEFIEGIKQVLDSNDNPYIDSSGNIVEVCLLERNREKNYNPYHTFLAPETVRCVKKYIDERNDPNQDGIDYLMRRIYSPTDILFIKRKFDEKRETIPFQDSITRDINGNVIAYDDSIRALGDNAITKMYARLRKALNIKSIEGEYSPLRSHGVRHYFSNNYRNIDGDYKEHWLGHRGNTIKITYEDYDAAEGLQIYLKGLDGITFGDTVNYIDITDPSVDKIRYENKELVGELSNVKTEISELKSMMKFLNQVEDFQSKVQNSPVRPTTENISKVMDSLRQRQKKKIRDLMDNEDK